MSDDIELIKNDIVFVQYNDNNINHILNGPDYGQPWSYKNAWTELDSIECILLFEEIVVK